MVLRYVAPGARDVEASTPAPAQRDPFPIYTYLMALGLSPADVRSTGDAMRKEIRRRVAVMAVSDDADKRRRYLEGSQPGSTPEEIARGVEYRAQANRELIGDVFVHWGFSAEELRKAETILGITGLAARVKKGPLIARTVGPKGPEDFEFIERANRPGGTVLRSLRDGKVYRI